MCSSLSQKILVIMKHNNLYLGLVLPSGAWQSPIQVEYQNKHCLKIQQTHSCWQLFWQILGGYFYTRKWQFHFQLKTFNSTFGGGLAPTGQIIIEKPLASFVSWKNDLSMAPIANLYMFANILFWKFGKFTISESEIAKYLYTCKRIFWRIPHAKSEFSDF